MARRVFFSFHFEDSFRANQVRMANVVLGTDTAGFYDHSAYEEAKAMTDVAIQRLILRHLENTTVTVVLISRYTWVRPWIRYEIDQSIERKNGLLGIYVHHLKDPNERRYASILGDWATTSSLPVKPSVPAGVEFPAYVWDAKNTESFARMIEEAGQRSDVMRRPEPPQPSRFLPVPPPRPRWIP